MTQKFFISKFYYFYTVLNLNKLKQNERDNYIWIYKLYIKPNFWNKNFTVFYKKIKNSPI